MHCPVCGAESTQGLNYCKRCGASMITGKQASGPALDMGKLTGMFWAVAVFGLGGLMLLVGGVLGLVGMGVRGSMLGGVAVIFLLTILAISALLVMQISRLISIVAISSETASPGKSRALEAGSQPQLDSPPLAMPSVTEHTTRNFDKTAHEIQRPTR